MSKVAMGPSACFSVMVVVFVACLSQETTCQTDTQAYALMTQLFTTNSYSYKIRPVVNQSAYISTRVTFNIMTLNGIDSVAQTMTTTGSLSISWTDELLVWNPSAYGGITYAHYPQGDVWKPDVTLSNSNVNYSPLGISTLNVKVQNDGSVSWNPSEIFQSTCSIDMTYFPFDVQTCKHIFVIWSYTKDDVQLLSDGIDTSEYEVNSVWTMLNTYYEEISDDSDTFISFVFVLKRKALFDLLAFLLPVVLLTCLNMCVFILPCESGERGGFSITVFLSFAVFLTIFEAAMPQNSDTTPIVSVYVILQTIQSTIITMVAMVMLRLYSLDEKDTPVPGCLITAVRVVKLKYCSQSANIHKIHVVAETDSETHTVAIEKELTKDDRKHDADTTSQKTYTWKEVVNSLDVLCLIIFAAIFILESIIFFSIASNPPK